MKGRANPKNIKTSSKKVTKKLDKGGKGNNKLKQKQKQPQKQQQQQQQHKTNNPILHAQQQQIKKDFEHRPINIKKKNANDYSRINADERLEDVDDISYEEYKKSEINTKLRVKDHVFEGGDEYDNFDILGSDDDCFADNIFEFDTTDYGSTDFLSDDQISQFKRQLKKDNVSKEYHLKGGQDNDNNKKKNKKNNDDDDEDDDDENNNKNQTKLSKKEKERIKQEKRLQEAKKIQFKELPAIKKRYWKDTMKQLNSEDHREMRIKIKANVSTSFEGQEIPRPILKFDDQDLPLSMKKFIQFLTTKYPSITAPTPVQSQCWPGILSGQDILSIAQTGSGKTLGYLLPAIPNILEHLRQRKIRRQQMTMQEKLENKKKSNILKNTNMGPMVLIIVPTRELAKQVESSCKPLRSKFNIHSIAIYGGVDANEQKDILGQEHNEIIIATPGRLVDLIQRSKEVVGLLGGVGMLILDEADRMLQLGFGDQLQKISEQIRPDRQTLMFSATFPQTMQDAAKKWLTNPLKIRVKSSSTNQGSTSIISKNVKQVVKPILEKEKSKYLTTFITSIMKKELLLRNRSLILIFVNTIKSVKPILTVIEKMCEQFRERKYKCGAIHGDMKQFERDSVIDNFKSGKISILVATDILGRGIHIGGALRFVINYDFPSSLEQYVHRVGRTGRQGNKGHALTLFTDTPQNTPMARGLIKILEECKQQTSPDLIKLADNFNGIVSNEFDSIKKLLVNQEDEEEEEEAEQSNNYNNNNDDQEMNEEDDDDDDNQYNSDDSDKDDDFNQYNSDDSDQE
ncbi:hypothetical protein RB653_005262 [Dictyostelium firmibasis]|uniref:RNA helicase n=1 Tax=Dictyostelium firmibasis TaxID=79012 RepID=A0AAN7U0Y6_9MYCE